MASDGLEFDAMFGNDFLTCVGSFALVVDFFLVLADSGFPDDMGPVCGIFSLGSSVASVLAGGDGGSIVGMPTIEARLALILVGLGVGKPSSWATGDKESSRDEYPVSLDGIPTMEDRRARNGVHLDGNALESSSSEWTEADAMLSDETEDACPLIVVFPVVGSLG